ncbi:hypothetical protein GCM10023166_31720 [Paeniglutamicibacter cryotolerans]
MSGALGGCFTPGQGDLGAGAPYPGVPLLAGFGALGGRCCVEGGGVTGLQSGQAALELFGGFDAVGQLAFAEVFGDGVRDLVGERGEEGLRGGGGPVPRRFPSAGRSGSIPGFSPYRT